MEKSSDNSEFFLILTSDHGNIEEMFNYKSNEIQTCHSKNPVPFALKSYSNKKFTLSEYGELSDIAPTILDLLRIKTPKEFTGKSLMIKTKSTDMDSKITDLLNNQIKKDQHIGNVL
jgi:2,3-bisphosphoglycerate-independent phosphoglycerate mutase